MIQFKQLISKVLNEISDETIKKTKEYSDTLKDIEKTTKELGKTTKELGLGEMENPQTKFPGISIQDIKQIPGYDPLRVNIDSGGAIFVDGEFIGDAGSDHLINKLNQDKDLYLTYKSYILNKIEDALLKVDEKLTKSTPMKTYIKDFRKSDAPQFKGKSKEKRRQMAIAAKLSKSNK